MNLLTGQKGEERLKVKIERIGKIGNRGKRIYVTGPTEDVWFKRDITFQKFFLSQH